METEKKLERGLTYSTSSRVHSMIKKDSHPILMTISSGKGGVGKTISTIQMAFSASRLGYKVLILDGDMGLSNVDVILGIKAKTTIDDLFNYDLPLDKIILDGPGNIKIISSGSGITGLETLSPIKKQILNNKIGDLKESFDIIFIDTGAGIGSNVMHLNQIAQERIIVTTSEPHAVTDAYALIKILSEDYKIENLSLMVNQVRSPQEGLNLAKRFTEICEKYLKRSINYLGCVPYDPSVTKQVIRQQMNEPDSVKTISGQAWNHITKNLISNLTPSNVDQQQLFKELFHS